VNLHRKCEARELNGRQNIVKKFAAKRQLTKQQAANEGVLSILKFLIINMAV
jgi:hypothetical protein